MHVTKSDPLRHKTNENCEVESLRPQLTSTRVDSPSGISLSLSHTQHQLFTNYHFLRSRERFIRDDHNLSLSDVFTEDIWHTSVLDCIINNAHTDRDRDRDERGKYEESEDRELTASEASTVHCS